MIKGSAFDTVFAHVQNPDSEITPATAEDYRHIATELSDLKFGTQRDKFTGVELSPMMQAQMNRPQMQILHFTAATNEMAERRTGVGQNQ